MLVLFILLGCLTSTLADVPVHCLYEEIKGTWTISEGERTGGNTINCDGFNTPVYTQTFTLAFPDVATDEFGNQGNWVLMVDEGFEININGRSYYAYFYYEETSADAITSFCNQTFNGWSRDKTVRNWSCFNANKNTVVEPKLTPQAMAKPSSNKMFKNDHKLIELINSSQKSWWAKPYPHYENFTEEQMFFRAGGRRSLKPVQLPPVAAPITEEQRAIMNSLPESFDWRNVDGVNYVSPIRDQGACGSCYSFASMAILESRLRIATKNQRQDVFSPQDAMICTVLGQGCDGGFNFLTAGRHAMEQGVVAEECNPYMAEDEPCDTDPSCPRTYVSEYEFIGGYFGASNEANMMQALVENGPIGVALLMVDDLLYYGGGIYHNTGISNEFDPFEWADHAVLLVGYGVDSETGEKYWTLKNSWGEEYGEQGYFRIRRGVDENAIESCGVQATVIP